MSLPGSEKRIHDFSLERRWTVWAVYRDRAKLFARIAIVAGLASMVAWLMAVELDEHGRANLGRYVYVTWMHVQGIEDPVELTLDGEKYRARPAEFYRALRETDYQARGLLDLGRDSMWAGLAGALLVFAGLLFATARRRPVERDDEITKGYGLQDTDEFQRQILASAARAKRAKKS